MFVRASSLLISLVAVAAAVSAAPESIVARGGTDSQCDTGSLQCCNSVQDASSSEAQGIIGLLGLGSVTGLVGITCTPLSVVGVGGNSCTQQPVCCTGNNFNGVINIGCTPVNLNL